MKAGAGIRGRLINRKLMSADLQMLATRKRA